MSKQQSLMQYCKMNHPGVFHTEFTAAQEHAVLCLEAVINDKDDRYVGQKSIVMDRGTGATSIAMAGMSYAAKWFKRKYVLYVSTTNEAARQVVRHVTKYNNDTHIGGIGVGRLRDGYAKYTRLGIIRPDLVVVDLVQESPEDEELLQKGLAKLQKSGHFDSNAAMFTFLSRDRSDP